MTHRHLAYNIAIAFISVMALGIFVVGFVAHAINENNKPFCSVVIAITEPRPAPPVKPLTTEQAKTQVGRDLQKYNEELAKYNREVTEYNKAITENLLNLSNQYDCK